MIYSYLHRLYAIVLGCLTMGCQTDFRQESSFKLLKPEETGITFNNLITETDTLNPLNHIYMYNGAGVGVIDVNNDGLPDLFFTGNVISSKLYLNKGNLQFEDITDQAGVGTSVWCTGVSVADINADGFQDIYVSVADKNYTEKGKNLLFINQGDNTFKEEAASYGLDDEGYSTQAAFFDYDRDGDLDIYLLTNGIEKHNHNNIRPRKIKGEGISTDRLYRNNGDNTFTDVSKEAGITAEGYGLGIGIFDVNDDGWPDVYCANDFITNDLLWINNGDGTFTDSLTSYVTHISHNGMGMDIADVNNDGLRDILVVDMLPEDNVHNKSMTPAMNYNSQLLRNGFGYAPQFVRNTLQLNRGKHGFSEIGRLASVHKTDWSWAPLIMDFDNDGTKDLFISNGYGRDITDLDYVVYSVNKNNPFGTKEARSKQRLESMQKLPAINVPNYFFLNNGDLTFSNVTQNWDLNVPSLSNGSAYADLDRDGDLDLITNNINSHAFIYQNLSRDRQRGDANHYLSIKLKGTHLNPDGIGTQVTVFRKGENQYRVQYPVRGYVSTVENILYFGLGKDPAIDSVIIKWPDGNIEKLLEVEADQRILVDHQNADDSLLPSPVIDPFFTDISYQFNHIVHKENYVIDYENQPLLLKMFSREGPGLAVGDVNNDGLEDLFVGSAYTDTSFVWLQDSMGNFTERIPLNASWRHEDEGALFFDADQDGDPDLYVTSGGNQYVLSKRQEYIYHDRLYINDGSGKFQKMEDALPKKGLNTCAVVGADFDRDGDIDLFVGSRLNPHRYPEQGDNYLLQNNNGVFSEVTDNLAPDLKLAGLVTGALWTDFDNDGWADLIVVGEWMPVRFFRNSQGRLEDVTNRSQTGHLTGFWNSIKGADFDLDGDIDYVIGNHGINSELKASEKEPVEMLAKDFDKNGSVDPVVGYYVLGESYPFPPRDAIIAQMNAIRRRYPRYKDYANITFDQLFTKEELKGALKLKANHLKTTYLENLGNGTFRSRELPIEAQMAPVLGIFVDDFNQDLYPDILLTGNRRDSELLSGYLDGSMGIMLMGKGNGTFTPVSIEKSGFYTPEDTRSIVKIIRGSKPVYLVGCNNESLKAFLPAIYSPSVRLTPKDQFAKIVINTGLTTKIEFYYGAGYLSQSSRTLVLHEAYHEIEITDFEGKKRPLQKGKIQNDVLNP